MSARAEMSPRRRRTSPPPASLPDDDDLLREILLRLPPRPSSLPRASLVSKRWRSLVADPQFQRRSATTTASLLSLASSSTTIAPVRLSQCWADRIASPALASPCLSTRTTASPALASPCLYSSETGIWGNINSLELESYILSLEGASTSIGNSFCWLLTGHYRHVILEFDLDTQSLAVTELPPLEGDQELRIVPAQDGGLGFIHVSQFHAQLWKRKPDSNGLALAVWVLDKAIEFEELRSTYKGDSITLVGFAEESNAVLALTVSGVFMVYLQSVEFKKISNVRSNFTYYPFACCYAAGFGILDGHDGDEVSNNM